ncbi:hypothetical protein [Atlantibacter hermannii]
MVIPVYLWLKDDGIVIQKKEMPYETTIWTYKGGNTIHSSSCNERNTA